MQQRRESLIALLAVSCPTNVTTGARPVGTLILLLLLLFLLSLCSLTGFLRRLHAFGETLLFRRIACVLAAGRGGTALTFAPVAAGVALDECIRVQGLVTAAAGAFVAVRLAYIDLTLRVGLAGLIVQSAGRLAVFPGSQIVRLTGGLTGDRHQCGEQEGETENEACELHGV